MARNFLDDPQQLAPPRAVRIALDDGSFVLRSPEPLKPYARCIGEWLDRWAAETPDAPAFSERHADGSWRRLSSRQTREQVGRIAQSLPGWGTIGVAYLHRRDDGRAIDHEVGGDLWITPLKGLDLTARAAYDLQNPGLSELIGSVRWTVSSAWRVELLTTHRSSARILPATSLFSVLGDVASQYLGGRVRWRAAPRLDLVAEGGARRLDDIVVENARARAILRLDDLGRGALSLELRRQGARDDAGWTGVRGTLRLPVASKVSLGVEAELVRPDRPATRGEWWPWGLVAATFQPTAAWDVALAAEGSVTREDEASFDVLARVTYRWEAKP